VVKRKKGDNQGTGNGVSGSASTKSPHGLHLEEVLGVGGGEEEGSRGKKVLQDKRRNM